MAAVTLKRFDAAIADICRAYLVVGRKGSGKTTLLITLLRMFRDQIDYVAGMFGSQSGLRTIGPSMPAETVYDGVDIERFEIMISTLKRIANAEGYERRVTAILFDDIAYCKEFFKCKTVLQTLMNGRWLFLGLFITQQYLMGIGPEIRTSIDYVFALAEPDITTRRKLHLNYFSVFPTFAEFDRVFTSITGTKGRALVIDNTSVSAVVQERVFFIDGHPGDEEGLVLGSRRFREIISAERERRHRRTSGNNSSENSESATTLTI